MWTFQLLFRRFWRKIRFVLPEFWHFDGLKPSNVWRELLFTYLSFTTLILRIYIAFVIVFSLSSSFKPPPLELSWVDIVSVFRSTLFQTTHSLVACLEDKQRRGEKNDIFIIFSDFVCSGWMCCYTLLTILLWRRRKSHDCPVNIFIFPFFNTLVLILILSMHMNVSTSVHCGLVFYYSSSLFSVILWFIGCYMYINF